MTLSTQEEYLIKVLRELVPFEEVRIVKDQSGKPDRFLVIRTQKIVVSEKSIMGIKL